jgi:hypothetical protein
MFKKGLHVLLILLLSLSVIPIQNVSASALAPVIKLSSGSIAEKTVLGIMEQTGMKTATRSAKDIASDRWRMEAYNQYMADNVSGKNADLWAQLNTIDVTLNNAAVTPIPDKPGFGKILVDASLYLSVFMLSYDVTSSLVDAYQNQLDLEFLDDEIKKQSGVSKYYQIYNYRIEKIPDASPYFNRIFLYDYQLDDSKLTVAGWGSSAIDYLTEAYITDWSITPDNKLLLYVYARYFWSGKWQVYNLNYTRSYLPDFGFTKFATKPIEVPDLNIPSVFQPFAEPDADPTIKPDGMPDQMEVVIPLDDVGYDSPEPWNDPVQNFEPEPEPQPDPDPEPEPTPEPQPEPYPEEPYDPNNPTVPPSFNPLGLLMPFLEFLLAMLYFLIRFADFIITIPFTPAKPFPEPYGAIVDWFMQLQYGPIRPYQLLMSVVSLIFGFFIYKMIRRVF